MCCVGTSLNRVCHLVQMLVLVLKGDGGSVERVVWGVGLQSSLLVLKGDRGSVERVARGGGFAKFSAGRVGVNTASTGTHIPQTP